MKTHANILMVHPYGYIRSKYDLSSGAVGSRARALYAAMLINAGVIPRENLLACFPQGYSKDAWNYPATEEERKTGSLGFQLALFLSLQPGMHGVRIKQHSESWGTKNDIEIVLGWARVNFPEGGTIHNVSDPVHIKRIRLIYQRASHDRWEIKYYPALFHRMSFRERNLREPLARLRLILLGR